MCIACMVTIDPLSYLSDNLYSPLTFSLDTTAYSRKQTNQRTNKQTNKYRNLGTYELLPSPTDRR